MIKLPKQRQVGKTEEQRKFIEEAREKGLSVVVLKMGDPQGNSESDSLRNKDLPDPIYALLYSLSGIKTTRRRDIPRSQCWGCLTTGTSATLEDGKFKIVPCKWCFDDTEKEFWKGQQQITGSIDCPVMYTGWTVGMKIIDEIRDFAPKNNRNPNPDHQFDLLRYTLMGFDDTEKDDDHE